MELRINRGAEVRQKYIRSINEIEEEVVNRQRFGRLERAGDFFVSVPFTGAGDERIPYQACRAFASGAGDQLLCRELRRSGDRVTVSGWCMADGEVKLDVLNAARQPISEKVEHYCRRDLLSVFPEYDGEGKRGFSISSRRWESGKWARFFFEMRNCEPDVGTRLYKWENGTRGQYLLKRRGTLRAISGEMDCLRRSIRCRASF